jgi:hypothetical protein
MSTKIHSREDYLNALKVVKEYKEQLKTDKLLEYNECTVDNIVSSEFIYFHNNKKAIAYWVSLDCNIPDRDPDAIIKIDSNDFYTIEGNRTPYSNMEEAYKAVIRKFRRNKLIK